MYRLIFAFFIISAAPLYADAPLETVPYVDLERYTGDWYEIARFDSRFQRNCTASKANYSFRDDGDIRVINTCRVGTPSGKLKRVKGRAWVVDKKTNSKLKVQFFATAIKLPFAAGDYWILELDPNYQYVLVGTSTRNYLWILSRTHKLDDSTYQYLLGRAREMGFDTDQLVKTIH